MPEHYSFTTHPRGIDRGDKLSWGRSNDWDSEINQSDGISVNNGVVRPAVFPTEGLLAHWPLTESSGDALDKVGNNDGTVTGAKQGVTVDGRTAYSLDGQDDKVNFGQIHPATVTGAAWVYPADISQEEGVLVTLAEGSSASGNFRGYQLVASGGAGNPRINFGDGGEWHSAKSPHSITENTWVHLGFVHTGTEARLYVNGDRVDTTTEGFATSSEPLVLGQDYTSFTYQPPYHGSVSDVVLYNRALSDKEFHDLYTATK